MRETTSAICSESARDSLMASPNSFIRCFSCWSTNPPGYLTPCLPDNGQPDRTQTLTLDAAATIKYAQCILFNRILNPRIGKIESNGKRLYIAKVRHRGAYCRTAGETQPRVRGVDQRRPRQPESLWPSASPAVA